MVNYGIVSILIFLIFILFKKINKESMKNSSVHYLYIVGILVSIIIVLLTGNYGNNGDIVSYISFAATLASLILAILAIIQSMISYSSFNGSAVKINDASDNLSQKSIQLNEASKQIIDSVSIIEKRMEKIGLDVCEIRGMQSELMDQKVNGDLKLVNKEGNKSIDVEVLVASFMESISMSGLIALYIMKIAKNRSMAKFNLRNLLDRLVYSKYDYVYGFLVATSSIGIINFTSLENDEIRVTYVNSYMDENILDVLSRKLKEFEKQNPGVSFVSNEIDKINKFFNECR